MINARGLDLVMVEVERMIEKYLEEYVNFWEGDRRGYANTLQGPAGRQPDRNSEEIQYDSFGNIEG